MMKKTKKTYLEQLGELSYGYTMMGHPSAFLMDVTKHPCESDKTTR